MNRPTRNTILRWIWLILLFAGASSIGWMEYYYWAMERFYSENEGLALARAYARDFEKRYHRLPTVEELIPFAEKRLEEDLPKMDFWPGGDTFTWKPKEG